MDVDQSAAPAAGAAIAATPGGSAADDGEGTGEEDLGTGEPASYRDTFQKLRDARAARDAGAGTPAADAGDGADDAVGEGADDGHGLEDDPLVIDLGVRREGEEPLRIVAADTEMADRIREKINGSITREAAFKIRDDAEARASEAEEIRYIAQLDPGGFLLEHVKDTESLAHVAQVLLTRPGVLESIREWVAGVMDDPERIQTEARLVKADRVERESAVRGRVEAQRREDQNVRAVKNETFRAINAMVPDSFTNQAKDAFYRDVMLDIRTHVTQHQLATVDPKIVPKFVKDRLALYGVTPRKATVPTQEGKGPAGATRTAATRPTADSLRQGADLRRRAAGAGPGAGSPAAQLPKPPKGTMLTRGKDANGKIIPSTFDWLRERLPALRRASR